MSEAKDVEVVEVLVYLSSNFVVAFYLVLFGFHEYTKSAMLLLFYLLNTLKVFVGAHSLITMHDK